MSLYKNIKMKATPILILAFMLCQQIAVAQNDLMKELQDSSHKKEYVTGAFKSSRVINGHSIEMIAPGALDVRILHRFGPVNQGISELFGLDQATMRLGFDYGISKNLTIGIGRSTEKKELDGFLKFRVIQQAENGSPVSLVLIGGMSVQAYKNTDSTRKLTFQDRSGYYYQAIVGRKFSQNFSLQLSPTVVYRNEVITGDENAIYAMGVGARYKVSHRVALVVDYFYVANGYPHSQGTNPLSLGIDIETGGHVFQLHFSNSSGLAERAFITETTNKWGKGDIMFGFNLSRIFNLKKKKIN